MSRAGHAIRDIRPACTRLRANPSLVTVLRDRARARLEVIGSLPRWRSAAGWFAQPIVSTRGHMVLAIGLCGIVTAGAHILSRVQQGGSEAASAAGAATSGVHIHREHPQVARSARLDGTVTVANVGQADGGAAVHGPVPGPHLTPNNGANAGLDLPDVAGIVGHLPGNALALIRDSTGTHPVAVGGAAGGWTLVELSPTDAVFERDGIRRAVELPDVE